MGIKLVEALRAQHKPVKKAARVLKARTTDQDVERAKCSKLPGISDAEYNLIKQEGESIKQYIERSRKEKRASGGRLNPKFWDDLKK